MCYLQKYRSHRKHLLAREAEAASWSQRRQMYGGGGGGGGGGKREVSPWGAPPTMGFPPMTPMHPHFRPLHVWGHPPAMDQSLLHVWPKHLPHSPSPPPPPPTPPPSSWPHTAAPPPPPDSSYWHHHHHHQRVWYFFFLKKASLLLFCNFFSLTHEMYKLFILFVFVFFLCVVLL